MLTLFAFLLFVPQSASDCGDDPDWHLDQIPSIQVAGTISTAGHIEISLDSVENPFKTLLAKRGIKIDQNNYANVVSTTVEVTADQVGAAMVYAVSISSKYEEACSTNRLGLQASCILWETFVPLRTFSDPKAVEPYVLAVVSSRAQEFLAQFDSQPTPRD